MSVLNCLCDILSHNFGGNYEQDCIYLPGQGAQSPMMGKDIIEAYPAAKAKFDAANDQLDFDLYDICHTENELLNDTAYTQPALLAVSIAITEVITSLGIKADYTAGLSLGEYSALVAAGSMKFEDAVKVVPQKRTVDAASRSRDRRCNGSDHRSDRESIQGVIDQVEGYVAFANFNNPKQIVLSGEKQALEACYPLFKEAGIRAIPLNVSGAFHSELMRSAADGLAEVLGEVTIEEAKVPYLTNVTGSVVGSHLETKDLLIKQIDRFCAMGIQCTGDD